MAQPAASAITYHPFGGVKRMTLRNGQVWSNSLDQDGRVTSYTLAAVTYTIPGMPPTASTRITSSRPPPIAPSTTTTWIASPALPPPGEPDASATTPPATCSPRSDLRRCHQTNYTFSIAPTSNRMTGISNLGIGYSFNAAGNRTGDGRITYVYNQRGRMNQVRIINGAITDTYNYLINGHNLRVRKTGPSHGRAAGHADLRLRRCGAS